MRYISKWLLNLKKLCPVCGDNFSAGHFKKHYQCPFSVRHESNEFAYIYQDSIKVLEHIKTHNIETKNVLCDANELKVRNSLNHMEIHNDCVFASEIC